jgi:hypothetical protein
LKATCLLFFDRKKKKKRGGEARDSAFAKARKKFDIRRKGRAQFFEPMPPSF